MGSQQRRSIQAPDFQTNSCGNVEGLPSSLQNSTAPPEVTLDTRDRMQLQRLIRLAHVLQSQEEGASLLTPQTQGPNTTFNLSDPTAPPMPTPNLANQAGILDQGDEDKNYELCKDDVSDCQFEGSASKSLSPNAAELDSNSSQTRPHAAVEKRYRKTVNTKLQQLYASIPASGKFTLKDEQNQDDLSSLNEGEQAAKPAVLDKAIQYVTHLVNTYRKYDSDIQELRKQIRDLADEDSPVRQSTLDACERPLDTR